ncbi:MAG: NAD(P)-binding protein [Myxococcales bacterium]
MPARDKAVEVAIVGGGCAGMVAAFELSRPIHAGKYRVTVYQMGWRLGGKGASGRGPAGRIEEHGLHLWMGFYENAFRIMRECYAELGRDPRECPIADWRDAFVPDHFNGLADWSPRGEWLSWRVELPPFPGLPGDPDAPPLRMTVTDYLARTATLLRTLLEAARLRNDRLSGTGNDSRSDGGVAAATLPPQATPGTVMEAASRFLRLGQLATLGAVVESARLLETMLAALPSYPKNVILTFHEAVAGAARNQLEALINKDDETRRLWEIIDLSLAVIRGSIRFGLATDPRGFDAIDDYDCREWLLLNGAAQSSIDSAFVRALYDLAFAYEDGDVARPRIAAGQALRGAVRAFFTYRGAFFWKMRAGMGDVVFAPLYEVLKKRGVRFQFFHRLENVGLSTDDGPPRVVALDMAVQAQVKGGGEYQPLVPVHGLPCWPSEPDHSQLAEGGRLKREGWQFESHWERRRVASKTLRVGSDFDAVVLAVGVGAVPHVAGELVARDPRWRTMVEKVKSVPTQALQLWMNADMKDLGWREPPVNISGFVEPFDTWADMSHLVPREDWPAGLSRPRSIAYFCSVLPDQADAKPPTRLDGVDRPGGHRFPIEQREQVRQNAIRFLNRDIVHLWPSATRRPGEFRWELLVDPGGRPQPKVAKAEKSAKAAKADDAGEERLSSQYWTANVNPSDRYVLSLPGSLVHRISPLDNSYNNLTVAGDWTNCGFNEGCVEAAVMSGRLAAHAIAQSPRLEDIVGYDHP